MSPALEEPPPLGEVVQGVVWEKQKSFAKSPLGTHRRVEDLVQPGAKSHTSPSSSHTESPFIHIL